MDSKKKSKKSSQHGLKAQPDASAYQKPNEDLEWYYRAQRVVPEGEWAAFEQTLRSPLPCVVRINKARQFFPETRAAFGEQAGWKALPWYNRNSPPPPSPPPPPQCKPNERRDHTYVYDAYRYLDSLAWQCDNEPYNADKPFKVREASRALLPFSVRTSPRSTFNRKSFPLGLGARAASGGLAAFSRR